MTKEVRLNRAADKDFPSESTCSGSRLLRLRVDSLYTLTRNPETRTGGGGIFHRLQLSTRYKVSEELHLLYIG